MRIMKKLTPSRFGALLLAFAMLLTLMPYSAITARAAGETAPKLDGGTWEWNEDYPGVVATIVVDREATLAEDKAMAKSSQWSTDGVNWSAEELTTATVGEVAGGTIPGGKIYIYTPLSGMSDSNTAVLPNIKADVTVEMDPSITEARDYFMYYYAYKCTALDSLGVPDTGNITTAGARFMTSYANGCTSLTSLSVPDTGKVESAGDLFMGYYASDCISLLSLDAPDTESITTVGKFFMASYAHGDTKLTSLGVPDTRSLGTVGNSFMTRYADGCISLLSLDAPDTGNITIAGEGFMANYASGCTSLTSLSIPNISSGATADVIFMYCYAEGCTSLTSLKAEGGTGYFAENDAYWGIDEPTGKKITFFAPEDSLEAWFELMETGTGTLYTSFIRNTTHEPNVERTAIIPNSDTTAPILEGGSVNRTSETEATISFTTNEAGTAYYLAVSSGEGSPSNEDVARDGNSLGFVSGVVEGKVVTLEAGVTDIYVVVVDASGNASAMLKIEAADYYDTPILSGSTWTWGVPGVVATMVVDAEATLVANKGMVKSSQWSTDGANWSADTLTKTTVGEVADGTIPGGKIYIYTPLSCMGSGEIAVLPNIKADVTVEMDPSITDAGDFFMAFYVYGCESLTSLGVPDTSSITTAGESFMYLYAYGCTALTSLNAAGGPGYFAENDVDVQWGIDEDMGAKISFFAPTESIGDWFALTDESGETLFTNFIKDTTHEINNDGDAIVPIVVPDTLTGTVTINNTSPKIGDTLTASLEDGNNTGTLSYQWEVDGVNAGTDSTYTVVIGDLGKIITVTITSDKETGSITSDETLEVAKKDAPTYTVTVNGSYAGNSGAGVYEAGDTVTINAGSRGGYTFKSWAVARGTATLANSKNATTSFKMPDMAVTITAVWTKNPPPILGKDPITPIKNTPVVKDKSGNILESDKAGKITIPSAGGTITLPNGAGYGEDATIAVDGGAIIIKTGDDLNITGGATLKTGKGTQIDLIGGGIVISANSAEGVTIIVGRSGASVKYPSGITLNFVEDEEIVLDATKPFGFHAGSAFPFIDVSEKDWFYDGAAFVYNHRLFIGTSADKFSPNVAMTRGMLVTVMHRAAGLPAPKNKGAFTDVPAGEYYSDAADWAYENSIVNGTGGGRFSPNDNITREQLVTMLRNFAKHMGIDMAIKGPQSVFADNAGISTWAADAVKWAQGRKLVVGKPGNLFDPKAGATRAEVAVILQRFIEMT